MSALGNIIACNDHVALVHADIDQETEEIIQDVLGIEVFRCVIGGNPLVGSNIRLTNVGGLVSPRVSMQEMEELSAMTQLPITAGTVNNGLSAISAGLIVNDFGAIVGSDSTGIEMQVIDRIFDLRANKGAA